MDRPHKDIVVVIALEPELEAFFAAFRSISNLSTDELFLHEVDSGVDDISMMVVHLANMGRDEAGRAAQETLKRYDVGLLVMLGIAGALSDDVSLGDVCYSGRILDAHGNNKTVDTGAGMDIEFSAAFFDTSERITRSLNYARTQPDNRTDYLSWRSEAGAAARSLCPDPVLGRHGTLEPLGEPSSINGTIACGMVSGSKKYNERLKSMDRKVLAIETESGAIFREAKSQNAQALTIRAISDYADHNKGKLEGVTGGVLRKIASQNAVSFFRMQLRNRYFVDQVRKLRPGPQRLLDLSGDENVKSNETDILDDLSDIISTRLRELSPEYRFQPKGYRVPAPRVRRHEAYQTGASEEDQGPVELRDALKVDRRLLISVPRSYPDQSLAWVIAHDLLDAELDGKQAVPLVIDGKRLSPPSRNLSKLSDIDLDRVSHPGRRAVFIVENLPVSSPAKLKFLVEEALAYEEAHFIFLSRSSANVLSESDFKIDLSVAVYGICNISFLQIANFIQRSLEMTCPESEVVAKRLCETFDAFDLAAHPTYFAGIPRETLTALLHANRRAELIQLAVDGFLTIVVADDAADVTLSRTTRSRFLGDLVVDMHVNINSYDSADVVRRAAQFAQQQDFDIDPVGFIKAFEDKGILHFEDGRGVQFSLPFIEHYLLAKRLADDESLAEKYFDVKTANFDPQAFDIYCELGPHKSIKQSVADAITAAVESIAEFASNEHILLTNELLPKALTSIDRLQKLQQALSRALDDIRSGKSNAAEKQRMLDIADRVKEKTAKHTRTAEGGADDERDAKLNAAIKAFVLGVMLLGSGSEHLLADEKRDLSSKLAELGALIVDIWTRRHAAVDFNGFKDSLINDEAIRKFREGHPNGPTHAEIKLMISGLVDMFEGAVLSDPLRQILGLLCEQARSKVLAKSLEHAEAKSTFANLLLATWLTDVDPARGKKPLRRVCASLPSAHFLRTCMATHCLSRTIWHHWKKQDRLSLLDAADEFLKPISTAVNKAEIKRRIEKHSPTESP